MDVPAVWATGRAVLERVHDALLGVDLPAWDGPRYAFAAADEPLEVRDPGQDKRNLDDAFSWYRRGA